MAARDDRLDLIGHLARWITWPRFIFAVTMVFFLTSILFPFYWMASSSFKTYAEIGSREPVYIPSALRLDAYRQLFDPHVEVSRTSEYENFGRNILRHNSNAPHASLFQFGAEESLCSQYQADCGPVGSFPLSSRFTVKAGVNRLRISSGATPRVVDWPGRGVKA